MKQLNNYILHHQTYILLLLYTIYFILLHIVYTTTHEYILYKRTVYNTTIYYIPPPNIYIIITPPLSLPPHTSIYYTKEQYITLLHIVYTNTLSTLSIHPLYIVYHSIRHTIYCIYLHDTLYMTTIYEGIYYTRGDIL